MKRTTFEHDVCPVARSLDVVGEWWSLLILRDAMLGVRRFSDFQRRLGMARNILSARLKHLVAAGVLRTEPASDGSAYLEYVLTDKGNDLLPALIALRQWGEKHLFEPSEPRTRLVDAQNHLPLAQMQVTDSFGKLLGVDDLTLVREDQPAAESEKPAEDEPAA